MNRGDRIFVRCVAVFVLLMFLSVPVTFVVSLWTGEWRWFITSIPAALVAVLLWVVVRAGVRA